MSLCVLGTWKCLCISFQNNQGKLTVLNFDMRSLNLVKKKVVTLIWVETSDGYPVLLISITQKKYLSSHSLFDISNNINVRRTMLKITRDIYKMYVSVYKFKSKVIRNLHNACYECQLLSLIRLIQGREYNHWKF